MWYFVRGHQEQAPYLAKQKLRVAAYDIRVPSPMSGIAFHEEDRGQVLSILGLSEPYETLPTENDGIAFLKFESSAGQRQAKEKPKPAVSITTWPCNRENKEYFVKVVEKTLYPVIKKNIEIFVPMNEGAEPKKDGVFRIFIGSTPMSNRKDAIETPIFIFGTEMDNRSGSFQPCEQSEESILIMDDETNYVVAELLEDNLFIHANLCYYGTTGEASIFREIVLRLANILAMSPEELRDYKRRIADERAKGRIIVKEWDRNSGSLRQILRSIKKILSPKVLKDIVFHNPWNSRAKHLRDGRFHIFNWSSTQGNPKNQIVAPEKIFGTPVDHRHSAFQPSGNRNDSIIIFDEATGYAVAELVGDNLFIHHAIGAHGTDREVAIFTKILEASVDLIGLSPEEIKERKRQKEIEKQRLEALNDELERKRFEESTPVMRAKYIKACNVRHERHIQERQRAYDLTNTHYEAIANSLVEQARKNKSDELFIQCLKKHHDELIKAYGEEFDRICEIPGVAAVKIERYILSVYTDPVNIKDGGETYCIGRFRIDICMGNKAGTILFFNISNRGRGPAVNSPRGFDSNHILNMHHPLIGENQRLCSEKLAEITPQFLSANEYSTLIMIALQFLQMEGVDDVKSTGLKWWPVAETTPKEAKTK